MTDRELMQQALYALQESKPIDINDPTAFYRSAHAIEALRARLAQPEPEPVAWLYEGSDIEGRDVCLNEDIFEEQKPNCIPLYTAPPQREWQGLTDEEIENCFEMSMFGTCRAIEAKLKAKNHD